MKDIVQSVVDVIFSFSTFMLLMIGLFIWIIISVGERDAANRETLRLNTEACYAQGMVLVQSDAGPRCVLPQSLVKVK